MAPIAIRAFTATTALGRGAGAQHRALLDRRSGLRPNDFGPSGEDGAPLPCWIGRVEGVEDVALPAGAERWDCRNNRLAWLALQQDGLPDVIAAVAARQGPELVATGSGTSTSSRSLPSCVTTAETMLSLESSTAAM